MQIDLRNELNESQLAAVLYNDGPSLVIAGAGSGKTRVLTYKIAHLMEQGLEPWRILALTFTNKAAREMRERIGGRVGENRARYLWMGTFHSMFLRILRSEAELIGFPPNFTIYDQTDSRSLIKTIVKEMQLDDKVYKPNVVQCRISNAKNRLMTAQVYAADAMAVADDRSAKMGQIREIYLRYQERCRQAGAMDFDDILLYTYLLFEQHPEVRERYAQQFAYVLVDEYQDTNYAQHSIVWQLTKETQRVCVVGDDAQSIYSFRGANIDNILGFTRQYTGARIFKLEENYRSTQMIVGAANSLIEKNREQIRKEVYSRQETGTPLQLIEAYSDVEEGEIVARQIASLGRKESLGYDNFAILYRTNAQSRIFEEALRKNNIPYRIYGGLSFYQRKEVKDVISYFRLAVNPHDEEAFKRVINYPARGIGDTTVGKIMASASDHGVSLWTVLGAPDEYGLAVNKGTLAKLAGFYNLVTRFIEQVGKTDAYELGRMVVQESGIMADLMQDRTVEGISRQENVQELMDGMHDFVRSRQEEGEEAIGLTDFLSDVALLTDQDNEEDDGTAKVTLMTVHAAKGLEFDTVFVVGMEEQLFPSLMAYDSTRQMEEERRLLYVAITRAEKRCLLSYAKSRFRYGKVEYGMPSRFLKDIDRGYISLPEATPSATPWGKTSGQSSWGSSGAPRFVQSSHVRSYQDTPKPATTPRFTTTQRPQAPTTPPVRTVVTPRTVVNESRVDTPRRLVSPNAVQGASRVAQLSAGQFIEHERFGVGEVLRVEGTGENVKALINFKNAGEKQLLLKFARFRVLG
ncbi:MAG: UvrD-helicase domain-containing protein [Bacteroidaceae bacterium]|nr:UvrD-helicase domain-containing protein [Bacteroidaceae bacterium]